MLPAEHLWQMQRSQVTYCEEKYYRFTTDKGKLKAQFNTTGERPSSLDESAESAVHRRPSNLPRLVPAKEVEFSSAARKYRRSRPS